MKRTYFADEIGGYDPQNVGRSPFFIDFFVTKESTVRE